MVRPAEPNVAASLLVFYVPATYRPTPGISSSAAVTSSSLSAPPSITMLRLLHLLVGAALIRASQGQEQITVLRGSGHNESASLILMVGTELLG